MRRVLLAALRAAAYILAVIFAILAVTEITMRLHARATQGGVAVSKFDYMQTIHVRIYQAWLDTEQKDPFLPPFVVFANKGFDDERRLRDVFEATRLPAGRTWTSHDFLQSAERANVTQYTVHSNALGFRGPEHARAKPPDTFRIIALGCYHTFGHGVNDDETYVSVLEQKLNENANAGQKFEVWNGGRHAASAITGLARMTFEIFAYEPDLLILDYGFVDPLIWSDNTMPSAMLLPDNMFMPLAKKLMHATAPFWGHSFLFSRVQDALRDRNFQDNDPSFAGTMRAMLDLAGEHGVPVILVRQMHGGPRSDSMTAGLFNSLGDVPVVTVRDVFRAHSPTPAEVASFRQEESWLTEVEPRARKSRLFDFAPYRLDIFQLSRRGHEVLANALHERLRPHLPAARADR